MKHEANKDQRQNPSQGGQKNPGAGRPNERPDQSGNPDKTRETHQGMGGNASKQYKGANQNQNPNKANDSNNSDWQK